MPVWPLLIATLTLLAASAAGTGAFAQSKAAEALRNSVGKNERLLRCKTEGQPPKVTCVEEPQSMFAPVKRPVEPMSVFATTFSLHTANNLATRDSTAKFLRGLTGSSKVARKVTPTFMRISKSLPARYGLGVAVLASGAIAVYEMANGPIENSLTAPAAKPGTVFAAEGFRKIGEIDPASGAFRAEVASKP
jgi:hypothetical protein